MLIKEYPECPDRKYDCFACFSSYNCSHKCRILTEGIHNCPFYKTKDEFKRGVRHGQENRGTDANDD